MFRSRRTEVRETEARDTKTGRLEEIFTNRKMSQESLASHAGNSSGRFDQGKLRRREKLFLVVELFYL